ncbi:ammonia-forming cytochrome c nitrite reductase subunit c552 [Zhongshania sp. BJYM1]|uniref:ammonia-forming cytochrome c nitrite reductase subunit c552 n=1 Tax=Zhongshania aquatica TaxID=2965069 RepID=UPI0022B4BD71|nr:ammonia-forming cytochrome c nitrite reductase subunit c552 [Marortus sp. BJYM1]
MKIVPTIIALIFLAISSANSRADDSLCLSCHADQAAAWQQSHHYKSIQVATPDTVLGLFNGGGASYNSDTFKFNSEDGKFYVSINHASKAAERYEIKYTFGFYPLQQYLAELPKGKYQALPVAWDSRAPEEGGQRWYALESDLEWDHYAYTWNTSCAECHSTEFKKAYDVDSQTFGSHFKELNVSCTACHGDASGHTAWLSRGQQSQAHAGFSQSLKELGDWSRTADQAIATRKTPPLGTQVSSCAQCHARRTIIDTWSLDKTMLDHIQISLTSPPLYYPDGQIKEEVFVTGSFLQSKMYAAGVVCSNCHDPHTTKLKAQGNALCSQCHAPQVFDTKKHHLHDDNSAGSQCVNCHMPATTYMGVDDRRDHRFGIPQPQNTIDFGIPNACMQCHSDKIPTWAAEQISTNLKKYIGDQHAEVFAVLEQQPSSTLALTKLLQTQTLAEIIYASGLTQLNTTTEDAALRLAAENLASDKALLRIGAITAIGALPPAQRGSYLIGMINDPSKAVRMTVARFLAGSTNDTALSDKQRRELNKLLKEYESSLLINNDNPAIQIALGELYRHTHRYDQAETAYNHAIAIDRKYSPAYINLADLHRAMGDENLALNGLMAASKLLPNDTDILYALSLTYFRQQQYDKGLASLQTAYDLAPTSSDINYVYAVALEQLGEADKALAVLKTYLSQFPTNVVLLELSARYNLKYGHTQQALDEIQAWLTLSPSSSNAQALYRQAQYLNTQRKKGNDTP